MRYALSLLHAILVMSFVPPHWTRRALAGLCVVVLIIGGASGAGAQPDASFAQRHWTAEDGLPVNSVRDIVQDPQGYLWLATYDGLARFDGVEFAKMNGSNSALPTSQIAKVYEGPEGTIWARTERGGLARIDPERLAVTQLVGRENGRIASDVLSVRVAGDSILWLRTERSIYRRRAGETDWTAVWPDTVTAQVMREDEEEGLWVGTEQQGLWRVRNGSGAPVAAQTPSGTGVRHIDALAIRAGSDGRSVRVASGTRLFRLEGGTLVPLPSAAQPLQRPALGLSMTPDGTLWAYTEAGALYAVEEERARRIGGGPIVGRQAVQMGPEGARWTRLGQQVRRNGEVVLAAGGRIQALTPDREGNWWVGTGRDGLYRLRRTPITMIDDGDGLPSTNVYGVNVRRSDSNEVWVTSINGGLATVKNGRVTPLTDRWDLPPLVWTVAEGPDGTVWIGTDEGLYRRGGDQTSQEGLPDALQSKPVHAVYVDRAGRVHVLIDGTLYTRRDGQWQRRSEGVPDDARGAVFQETENGSLWIGTRFQGLLRLRDDRLRRITADEGLANDPVLTIHEGASGHLWVGTTENGLTRIDRRGTPALGDDRLTPIGPDDGLPANLVIHVRADGQGRLWMSSHRGLFWVDRAALNAYAEGDTSRIRPVRYTEQDGLASREANGGVHTAGARTADGRLWFPTQRGVAVVDPSDADLPPPLPTPAAIESITPADTTVADTTYRVGTADTLHLRPEQRTFTVQYTGLHFSNPEVTRFRVQLSGFDPSPTRTDQRRARYTEVDPGTYTLVVQAAGEYGDWGTPARVTMSVAPFWWETWWFLGLCGLAGLGFVAAGYWWRTWRLQRRQQELEQTVAERTEQLREQRDRLEELDQAKSRFFANVSHEFRTPLTLIRGPLQQVRKHLERGRLEPVDDEAGADAEQLSIAERNVGRLQRLVDQLLGLARLDAGTYELNVRPTDVAAVVDGLVREFEPLAERAGLNLTVQADGAERESDAETDGPEPVYVDREALERIVSNLLSNALKFTPEGGKVTVTVRPQEETAAIDVRDTGPGIPAEEQEEIFDRFTRADDTPSREQEGIGIGLAYTKA